MYKLYTDGDIELNHFEDFHKKYLAKEAIALLNFDYWSTYHNCTEVSFLVNKPSDTHIHIKIKCFDGDNAYGSRTNLRWVAVFIVPIKDFGVNAEVQEAIDSAWRMLLESKLDEQEQQEHQDKLNSIAALLLSKPIYEKTNS